MSLKAFFLVALMILIVGCNAEMRKETVVEDSGVTLLIQPYNTVSTKEAEILKSELEKHLPELFSVKVSFVVLPPVLLDENLKNDKRTRFRADKILTFHKKFMAGYKGKVAILGYIHDDISVPYKGKADWGVLGLSFKGRNTALISTYRIRNAKKNRWRVATHEFIHAFFNYGHCPKDNQHCIMKDAKGKANFDNKTMLCDSCKLALKNNLQSF